MFRKKNPGEPWRTMQFFTIQIDLLKGELDDIMLCTEVKAMFLLYYLEYIPSANSGAGASSGDISSVTGIRIKEKE